MIWNEQGTDDAVSRYAVRGKLQARYWFRGCRNNIGHAPPCWRHFYVRPLVVGGDGHKWSSARHSMLSAGCSSGRCPASSVRHGIID